MAERSFPILTAVIACVGTLGAAAIGGYFTLAANDHKSPPPQPPATTPVSSSSASSVDTVVAGTTSPPASAASSASQSAAGGATLSGVPRQAAPGRQVTMRGSGFPAGDTVKVAYNLGPGQDWPLSSSPVQTDAQGRFTVTFTVLDIFCGYDGQMNTYDQGGDGRLLTSTPLAVVC